MPLWTYLKGVLIAEIKDEDIGGGAAQAVVAEVGPFEGRAHREVRYRRQVRDLQLVHALCKHDARVVRLAALRWPVFLREFAPDELLQSIHYTYTYTRVRMDTLACRLQARVSVALCLDTRVSISRPLPQSPDASSLHSL